ncbi:bifunctional UDP-N-acetylglucosamine diphosphorylase/glucosamine-1-phosphate N-acetyltransferase GlmU [Yunchengibacter salinarum]|uniref:bifunctional UDP-N-acetylglucosamine diphosphorylase/glucosamine-1-phosphate N-acetyltransferase GlmU n=1 Tax=Yunchengibacter salinarum TaxID=3133399 RepID=UPI0035B5B459
MTLHEIAVIVLAAGKGTRMKSRTHKVLHPIAGKPMIRHLTDTVERLSPDRRILVVGAGREQVEAALPHWQIAVQEEQLGTGDATRAALPHLEGFTGDVVVLYGDVPFVPESVMTAMLEARRASANTGLVVLGFTPRDPARYGRLVTAPDGGLERIVEYKDASVAEKAIKLCNSGMMVVDGARLEGWLGELTNDNAAGEFYLTDLVALARRDGRDVAVVEAREGDVLGINSRADLARAEAFYQHRRRHEAMDAGVSLQDPDSVIFAHDTVLSPDVTVEPHVVFGPGVSVADGATIRAFSHLEGCRVDSGATVGPYARLRPGTTVGADARIGNFVEVKKAGIGAGAKVNHLSYIGDATVGAGANVGAGTITCNYDGVNKHHTEIGERAFIGSNSALVAPVTIGAGALVGAGSTITADIAPDALGLTRARQTARPGGAARMREKAASEKAARSMADHRSNTDQTE